MVGYVLEYVLVVAHNHKWQFDVFIKCWTCTLSTLKTDSICSNRAGGWTCSCRRETTAGQLWQSDTWHAGRRRTSSARRTAAVRGGGSDLQDDASWTQSLLAAAARPDARSVRMHDEARGCRAANTPLPDGRSWGDYCFCWVRQLYRLYEALRLIHFKNNLWLRIKCSFIHPGFV